MAEENAKDESGLIYKNILQNMRDGVMAINLDGKIITFNKAAALILGISKDQAEGTSFVKIFLNDARNDEFNDLILKAIYTSDITHQKEVKYHLGNRVKYLQINTTFLTRVEYPEGKEHKYGIVVVFSDITDKILARNIKLTFGKYVDPRVAEKLFADQSNPNNLANRQVMSVIFTDMKNFTGISEKLSPGSLIALMNTYFTKLAEPIHDNQGIIDKFIGDALMAFWGPPFSDQTNHAHLACYTALHQLEKIEEINKLLPQLLEHENPIGVIDIKVGIATGLVLVGNIGSEDYRNFTVLGTPVNSASRLMEINNVYGSHILVAEETASLVMDSFVLREIDLVHLHGQRSPRRIFEVITSNQQATEKTYKFKECYESGLNRYRNRDWSRAIVYFEKALSYSPTDVASNIFLSRINNFRKNPPPSSWTGIWRIGKYKL